MKLNGEKSNLIFISRTRDNDNQNHALHLFNDVIRPVSSAKFLGVEIDNLLSFKKHFDSISDRATRRLSVLKVLAYHGTKPDTLMKLYKTYIRPIIEYGSISFISAPKMQLDRLQKIQNEAIRICLRLPRYIRTDLLHEYASMAPLMNRLERFNRKLIETMKKYNCHIESLVSNHTISDAAQSPLDTVLICSD